MHNIQANTMHLLSETRISFTVMHPEVQKTEKDPRNGSAAL